jgi:hypothetical protein
MPKLILSLAGDATAILSHTHARASQQGGEFALEAAEAVALV